MKSKYDLRHLVEMLRAGDKRAWLFVRTKCISGLKTAIRNDLLQNDLPYTFESEVIEAVWHRAQEGVHDLQVNATDTIAVILEWLQSIQNDYQEELMVIYHDMGNPQFIACLSQPASEADEEVYHWAWERVWLTYSRPLNQTIYYILSTRVQFTKYDIQDIWHEAYPTIQSKINDFIPEQEDSLLKWMSVIIRYTALNYVRKYLSNNPLTLDEDSDYKGADFEDPLDNEIKISQELIETYYDVVMGIIMQLEDDPVSNYFSIDEQYDAILMLFRDFEKPGAVASELKVEVHHVNNLQRTVKRRIKNSDLLKAMLG